MVGDIEVLESNFIGLILHLAYICNSKAAYVSIDLTCFDWVEVTSVERRRNRSSTSALAARLLVEPEVGSLSETVEEAASIRLSGR